MKKLFTLILLSLSVSACSTSKLVRIKPHLYDDGNKVYGEVKHKPLSKLLPCEEMRLKVKSISRTGIAPKANKEAFHAIRAGKCD